MKTKIHRKDEYQIIECPYCKKEIFIDKIKRRKKRSDKGKKRFNHNKKMKGGMKER